MNDNRDAMFNYWKGVASGEPEADDDELDELAQVPEPQSIARPRRDLVADITASRDRITRLLNKDSTSGFSDISNAISAVAAGKASFGEAMNAIRAQRLRGEQSLYGILLREHQADALAADREANRKLRANITADQLEQRRLDRESRDQNAQERLDLARTLGDTNAQLRIMAEERRRKDSDERAGARDREATQRKLNEYVRQQRLHISTFTNDPEVRGQLLDIMADPNTALMDETFDVRKIPENVNMAIGILKQRFPDVKLRASPQRATGPSLAQDAGNIDTQTARDNLRQMFEQTGQPGETPQAWITRLSQKEINFRQNPAYDATVRGLFGKANKRAVGKDDDHPLFQQWLKTPRAKAETIDPAPRDPGRRQVGKVYAAPDGRRVKWLGNGWEPVL